MSTYRGRGDVRGRGRADRGSFRGGEGRGQRGPRGALRGDDRGFRGGRGGPGRGAAPPQVYIPQDRTVSAPDKLVKNTEDAFQDATEDGLSLLSLENSRHPRRPGYGTRGSPATLWANYVELVPSTALILYRYNIAVSPDASGKKLTQIVRLLLETPEMSPFRSDTVTDFKATLITRQRLKSDDMMIEFQYRSESEDEPRPSDTKYRVRVQYTNTLPVSDLINSLTSTNFGKSYDTQPMVQAFNIFLNHYSKSVGNLVTIGSSKSFSLDSDSNKWNLGAGLTAIRGFFSSVRVATCRILVNVNVSHGAFYESDRLDQLIWKHQNDNGPSTFKLQKFLAKLRVRSTHLPERTNNAGQIIPRVKTIHGLATRDDGHGLEHSPRVREHGAGPKDVEFWLDGQIHSSSASTSTTSKGKKKGKRPSPSAGSSSAGKYISVFEFFKTRHGQNTDPTLPVVNVGTKERPSYLPAEVCEVMPGQPYNRPLQPRQTQQMIRFAVRRPRENANSIVNQGFQTTGLSPEGNALLERFDIHVSQGLITVEGRVLNEPKVVYREDNPARLQSGSWNMLELQFNSAGMALKKWSYLFVSTPGTQDAFLDPQSVTAVMNELHKSLEATGVLADKPASGRRIVVHGIDDPGLDNTLKLAAGNLDLLFIILPTANHELYPHVKRLGDVQYGIHTICCVGEKLAQPQRRDQYLKNLALKFNLKLGGTNQIVEGLHRSIINEDKTMVVGIDVTHPSPGSSPNAPSIAGMVANIDKLFGQWPATIRIQSRARKEEADNLTEMLKHHLALWKTKGKHQSLPENILVFRDGVSEGQYDKVIDEELPQLQKACKELYPPTDQKKSLPRFTIIIVGKRHHTRFYPTSDQTADRFSNTKPGTVVDRGVTTAWNWDFFLQPHAALQGTVRPAHYYVLVEEILHHRYKAIPSPFKNISDILEDLTHSMSYAYGRATKAVSVCPPAKYADMVCERARCYLNRLFDASTQSIGTSSQEEAPASDDDVLVHEKLRDTMFYI